DQEGRLTGRVELLHNRQGVWRYRDTPILQEPAAADDQGVAAGPGDDSAAGMGQELIDLLDRQLALGRLAVDQTGQGVFAALVSRGGRLEYFICGSTMNPDHVPELETAFRQRAGLV